MVLLLSTYDLGRQPFGLASAAAALRAAGHVVTCVDLSRQKLETALAQRASAVAVFLPMHTATRLALPVIARLAAANPDAHLIAYGLYAPLNAQALRACGVTTIIGGEFEDDLVRAVGGSELPGEYSNDRVPRVRFRVPDRAGLPPLAQYATLQQGTERRLVGYTEASRGCKHRCRHCPIVPVYDGRFRVVPVPVVMDDIAAQIAAGARHVTFGDPDFFNGIGHATAVLRAFAARYPRLSYDVTIKIEHLLRHRDALPLLRDTGCAFVTSAVESVDDEVLAALEKGHTRRDFEEVVELFRENQLVLSPTFVAFTPWTTMEGYGGLLRAIAQLGLVEHVAPIQFAIRLLVTEGSRLLDLPAIRAVVRPFNPTSLTYPWVHADRRVDALQEAIAELVGVNLSASRREVFARIWQLAHDAGATQASDLPVLAARSTIPYLNEPWYC